MTEEHRCQLGPACRDAETRDGKRHGAHITHQTGVCDTCYAHIESCVHQLPRDWIELRQALGDRSTAQKQRVKSTPTPAIPIATTRAELMSDIVELVDRAAAVISDATRITQPTGRRKAPEVIAEINGERRPTRPLENSAAGHAQQAAVSEAQRLDVNAKFVEQHLDALLDAEKSEHMVWAKPRPCPKHVEPFTEAQAAVKAATTKAQRITAKMAVAEACQPMGACDDCGGWDSHGQAAEIVEYTGLDLARQIIDTHNRVRADLGKTRLRHKLSLPCPSCQSETVGRDDGTNVVNCTTCESSWTDREYKFLVGLIAEEKAKGIERWLLVEAYGRLDALRDLLTRLDGDDNINAAGAGPLIIETVTTILGDHATRKDRQIATDKATARKRQDDDEIADAWKANEKPYRPPRRRKTKSRPEPAQRYAPSSLSTLTDDPTYLPDANDRKQKPCSRCHMIHRGDCVA